jgi:hypothetical protein
LGDLENFVKLWTLLLKMGILKIYLVQKANYNGSSNEEFVKSIGAMLCQEVGSQQGSNHLARWS